jgi:hypothetical protein
LISSPTTGTSFLMVTSIEQVDSLDVYLNAGFLEVDN